MRLTCCLPLVPPFALLKNRVPATQLTALLCMWTDFNKQVVDRLVQQRLCSAIMYKEMILKKEQLEGACMDFTASRLL